MELDFKGFSKLSRSERYTKLQGAGLLSKEELALLKKSDFLTKDLAEDFIENSLGYFPMPYGVVTHLRVNDKDVLVPMAVEETSIIAAASKTAKWIKSSNGRITTQRLSRLGVGQIQIAKLKQDKKDFEKSVLKLKDDWIVDCNSSVAESLFKRGGGVKDFEVRFIQRPDSEVMAVIHVYVDTCEAMGANVINQVCEYLKPVIEAETLEQVTMCILSNLMDKNLTKVNIELEADPELGVKIEEASLFAQIDPYRASTNNKGIMNAIDSVLIATGNDWRAVEAGVHAYVCNEGSYTSLSKWSYDKKNKKIKGEMSVPMSIGTVGGVTKLHPFAQLSMKLMDVETVTDLSGVIAAVGLVQNLGALKALTTVGIIEGHMRLHIKNLALGAGAKDSEAPLLQKRLEQILMLTKRITQSQAIEALNEIRQKVYKTTAEISHKETSEKNKNA